MDYKKLIKSFFSFSIGNVLAMIIGVISTPILTRILTPDQLGKASMFTLAINILMLVIVFGSDQAFVRFFYEEDKENRNKLLFNTLKIPFVLYFLISFIIIFFSEEISFYLFEEINNILIYILVIALFFSFLKKFSMIVLRMKQKGYTYSLMNFFNKLFDLIFIIFFAYLIGNRYEIRVLSQSIAILLVTLISIYFGRDIWNFINLNNNNKLKNNLKDIFHYSYPLLFASLISWVFQSFDKIAIRQWSTYNQLGLYTAAFKIVAILNIVKISFTTFWTPTSLEKYHEEKNNNKFFENMYSLVFIFMFLISLTTIAFKDIIILLLGSDYREAVTVMPLLVFMPFMYTISEITVIGINFKKKPKWHILISLVTSIINVTGNYFFVPLIGAKGAAISTGFSWIIFFTMRTYISLIYYKVNFKLVKSYFFIFTLFLYAMYVTFYYNIILNFIIYLIIIISFLIINFKFLKTNTLKLLKELK